MYCMLGSSEQKVAQRQLHAPFIRTKSCIVKKTSSMLLRRAVTHVLHARFIRTKSCPAATPCSVQTNKKLLCEEHKLDVIAQSATRLACKPNRTCLQTDLLANLHACKHTCLQTSLLANLLLLKDTITTTTSHRHRLPHASATNAALEQSSWRKPAEQET